MEQNKKSYLRLKPVFVVLAVILLAVTLGAFVRELCQYTNTEEMWEIKFNPQYYISEVGFNGGLFNSLMSYIPAILLAGFFVYACIRKSNAAFPVIVGFFLYGALLSAFSLLYIVAVYHPEHLEVTMLNVLSVAVPCILLGAALVFSIIFNSKNRFLIAIPLGILALFYLGSFWIGNLDIGDSYSAYDVIRGFMDEEIYLFVFTEICKWLMKLFPPIFMTLLVLLDRVHVSADANPAPVYYQPVSPMYVPPTYTPSPYDPPLKSRNAEGVERSLRDIERLHEQGLITDNEYSEIRKKTLEKL